MCWFVGNKQFVDAEQLLQACRLEEHFMLLFRGLIILSIKIIKYR